jgi:hypothetical protein
MPRHSDDPVRHIISCRINEVERGELSQLAAKHNTSISSMVREGLILYMEILKLHKHPSEIKLFV